MKPVKANIINEIYPNIDDSIKPNFKVFWQDRSTCETGECNFFTYKYGTEIIQAIFNTIYPERKILQIDNWKHDI